MPSADHAGSPGSRMMNRRAFLLATGATTLSVVGPLGLLTRRGAGPRLLPGAEKVKIIDFTDDGKRKSAVSVEKVVKTEAEWQKQLTPESFDITRHAGTERAFSGPLLNEHRKGVFRCICCDTACYDSSTKFESGTGWPSFWAPIAKENIVETTDRSFGTVRTAISCRRCDAHLGHVFDDGPQPTGLRYCMNSVALRFAKATA